MFLHSHPYPPFINNNSTRLIVGTLPPPRFSMGLLKEGDVDFCYGSRDGQLWRILDRIYNLNLVYATTDEAIVQRKEFLIREKIGICDIVESATRQKIDASDLGMNSVKMRNILGYLKEYPKVKTLLFTGGNSKNGPEYFFRKLLKEHGYSLTVKSDKVPREHEFQFDDELRVIQTISLTAPSGAANRAVGSLNSYKKIKSKNPFYNTFDFRVDQYRPFFINT